MTAELKKRIPAPLVLPRPVIRQRERNAEHERRAIELGLAPAAARILAARRLPAGTTVDSAIAAKLADIDPPSKLLGIEAAANHLADAVMGGLLIASAHDHDPDGISAATMLSHVLVREFRHPPERVQRFVGHRLTDGYGLTDSVVDRILSSPERADLVVTMDYGSCDEPRVARLLQEGILTIVTDHHQVPAEGSPKSAVAVINPNQPGCTYDKTICGATVAWLLACATRQVLMTRGWLPADAPSLTSYLDLVAVGTVADCVSISSKNNRAIVRAGLKQINTNAREAWRAFRAEQKNPAAEVTAETIAFGLAPRISARTRLSDPEEAVSYLLTEDPAEATRISKLLGEENERRKKIERGLVETALVQSAQQVAEGRISLVIYMPDGHHGVQGIVASRLVETFGRPALVMSPKSATEVVGSARGVEGFHVQQAIAEVAARSPGLVLKGGGHRAAGGVTIPPERVEEFIEQFEQAARRQMPIPPGPVLWTDGDLAAHELTHQTHQAFASLEPYGREFEPPQFDGLFTVVDVRPVGEEGTHLRLVLRREAVVLTAVWFRARRSGLELIPVQKGGQYRFVYSLTINEYRGRRNLELRIAYAVEDSGARATGPSRGYL
jgi:single-stranded-DNA-specific exonuclease